MNDPFQTRPELRYGYPVCDQLLLNRHFTVGYSWYFRQAKWTLEIVDPLAPLMADSVKRENKFRPDLRIPKCFRAGLGNYTGSGFDRGHLVSSANQDQLRMQNSETFLLSNMSPQLPGFNRGIWKYFEEAIRTLNEDTDTLEVYVLTAPVFDFGQSIKTIEPDDYEFGTDVPIPHSFAKSVLVIKKSGSFRVYSFLIPHEESDGDFSHYHVTTRTLEKVIGGRLWDRVVDREFEEKKDRAGTLWL